MHAKSLASLLFAGTAALAVAQDDPYNLSLDELLNMKVGVSSITEKSIREQPAIVSVLTEKEISHSGARDLMEVLKTVPGFHFGTDIGGIVGPIMRGLWAYEGKTAVILDGIEFNDGSYGTLQLNRHFPADQIQQVEIIRGPGSALYGGTAELSVIKITTKQPTAGGYVSTAFGATDEKISQHYSMGVGAQRGDFKLSLTGSFSRDYLSNERYVDLDGFAYDLADESSLEPWNLNLGAEWKGLKARVIYDYFEVFGRHSVGSVASPRGYRFPTLGAQVSYDIVLNDKLTVTPKVTYRDQTPWSRVRTSGLQKVDATRTTYTVTSKARLTEKSNLLVNLEAYTDKGYADMTGGSEATYFRGSRSVTYDDWSVGAQYEVDTPVANLTVGGRYEDHSAVGGGFVPRAGLTRAWEKFHVKALYSEAFRTPNIRVINESPVGFELSAEETRSSEVEIGYRANANTSLTTSIFHVELTNPYVYDDALGYVPKGVVSTAGIETELLYVNTWATLGASYSFYQADKNSVPALSSDDDDTFLAAPNHKLVLRSTLNLRKDFFWHASYIYTSELKGFSAGSPNVTTFKGEGVFNTFLEYRKERVGLGVGVNDIGNAKKGYAQPYRGGHPLLPEKSRELFVRATLSF